MVERTVHSARFSMETDSRTINRSAPVMASVSAPDLGMDFGACVAAMPADPCSIVILGATGDLTSRKLMPALFNLYRNGGLPEPFLVVGCGRTQWTDVEFRGRMQAAMPPGRSRRKPQWRSSG